MNEQDLIAIAKTISAAIRAEVAKITDTQKKRILTQNNGRGF